MVKRNILITGPMPDPVGGISIHLSRLCNYLKDDFNVSIVDESPIVKDEYFSIRRFNPFGYFRIFQKVELVHVHSAVPALRFLHCFTAKLFGKKLVITLHSYREQNFFNKCLNKISLSLADKIIAVSQEISNKVDLFCLVIPAYIKPLKSEFSLSDELLFLINDIKSQGKKLLVSNAFRLDDFDGRDLYGFDQIIDAFLDLRVSNNWVAVLNVSSIHGCEEKFNRMLSYININELSGKVYLFNKKINFCGLLKFSDVFVRATLTDGDALSVRESLQINVKTVVSDCVSRPEGTVLFKSGDVEALKHALLENESVTSYSDTAFELDIISLYKGLL